MELIPNTQNPINKIDILSNNTDKISKHTYKIASHNSMTYLTPRRWYLRPFAFTARCQSKTIQEQYEKYGVRMFDIRLKFTDDGEVYFAHGAIEYKCDMSKIYEYLNSLPGVIVRVLLENKPDVFVYRQFRRECAFLEDCYPNVKWCSGRNKYNWEVIYEFKYPEPTYTDKYSSNNVNEPGPLRCVSHVTFRNIFSQPSPQSSGKHFLILSGLLVKRRKTTSHLSRMIFHASSRHSSASSRKKSEVMQTLSISPLCILYCFFLSFDNGYLNPVFVL